MARLIVNNDSGCFYASDDPMDVGALQKQVDMLVGTHADTLTWNVGPPGGYRFDTRVSTCWGHGIERWSQARWYRVKENLESLLRRGIDPLRIVLDRGVETGIRVYPSVRWYDCQMGGDLDPLNREHPDWQIGEYPRYGAPSRFKVDTYLRQLDHAHAEVRQRLLDVVEELLERYEIEGIELDFQRRPHYFKPEEAVGNRHLLTDMLRTMRATAERAGRRRGKPVEVLCRVWMDRSDCWNLGMDVETWVKDGLIDVLIPSNHYYFALDHPIEQFAELIQGSSVEMCVSFCPALGQTPAGPRPEIPASWRAPMAAGRPILSDIPYNIDNDTWHAGAHVAYAKGATGIETFNFNLIPRVGDDWDRSILNELGDAQRVARHDKFYPYITPESVNLARCLSDEPVVYALYLADDPSEARSIELKVYITETTTADRITFSMNGRPLSMARGLTCPDRTGGLQPPEVDPHHVFECALTDSIIRRGSNQLQIELEHRNPMVSAPLTVVGVNVEVRYGP